MVDDSSNDPRPDVVDTLKHLIDGLPQPEQVYRTAAMLQGLFEASGLDKDEFTQAMAVFGTVLHQSYAELVIHHRDGSKQQFVERDFHYEIRPDSPYYDTD